jgi:hypothetical protein
MIAAMNRSPVNEFSALAGVAVPPEPGPAGTSLAAPPLLSLTTYSFTLAGRFFGEPYDSGLGEDVSAIAGRG